MVSVRRSREITDLPRPTRACRDLRKALQDKLAELKLKSQCDRMDNAALAVRVLEDLQGKEGAALVKALAAIQAHTSMAALGHSIASAAAVARSLGGDTNWPLLESVWSGDNTEGTGNYERVCDAIQVDDLVTSLPEALKKAERDATTVITRPPPKPKPPVDLPKGKVVVKEGSKKGVNRAEAKRLFAEIDSALSDGRTLNLTYEIIGP